MKQAKPRLIHIQTDLLNNFRRLGVVTKVLTGKERLKLMHDMFHLGDKDRFYFEWRWLAESGLSVKDFIAPTSFSFPSQPPAPPRGGPPKREPRRGDSLKKPGEPEVRRLKERRLRGPPGQAWPSSSPPFWPSLPIQKPRCLSFCEP